MHSIVPIHELETQRTGESIYQTIRLNDLCTRKTHLAVRTLELIHIIFFSSVVGLV